MYLNIDSVYVQVTDPLAAAIADCHVCPHPTRRYSVETAEHNNNNNNKHDNVYGAVIMAEPLREFTRFV